MTSNLYVLGHPVAHSKSPAMHNAAYQALGLDWRYGLADCKTEQDARAFIGDASWLALNITMPYKPLALQAASSSTAGAKLAGGANVLVRNGKNLLADNTDGKGCISYLKREGISFEDAALVVCGTGPTSLALLHAACEAGASRCTLLGRDDGKARAVLSAYTEQASDLGASPKAELDAGAYVDKAESLANADIILDATSLGMNPDDPAPFDTALLSRDQVVFDVVYGHGETTLLAAARAIGCAAFDGAGMLVEQAVLTVYDIVDWLDISVDPRSVDLFDIMAQAAGF